MLMGQGATDKILEVGDIERLLAQGFAIPRLEGKRVLVIIPDGTRTAPIPLIFRLLYGQLGEKVAKLDYLIALGTHPPMTEEAITHLIGVSPEERAREYPKSAVYNHRWDIPETFKTIGIISREEAARLTQGLLIEEVPVTLNKMIFDYDQLIICGPVFPHEVAGFSGGAKYLFPGIAGAPIINYTHWLGALTTSMETIGVKETPVRKVMHRAAEFVNVPLLCLAMVLKGEALHGIYLGGYLEAFNAAADLSAQLNVIMVPRPFKRVLSMPALLYDDLWTAAKAMYKTEPAIADGGEVIIYAPHITEISYTHGKLIDEVGYHVRDYFLKQEERFKNVPGSIKAHSTHVKGKGTFELSTGGTGKIGHEEPRIQVTLATGIPEERCRLVNLGYLDYRQINPEEWRNREDEGLLFVPHAGEMLYRASTLVMAR